MAELMAVLQDIDKCVKCRACQVACQRNWPRHQNSPKGYAEAETLGVSSGSAGMLVGEPGGGGTAEKMAADDPTVVKAQRVDDRAPFVKYNCWHCPSPPCVAACLATGIGALTKGADGAVHIEQHQDPNNPWDKQWCNPKDARCRDQGGRLVCVVACQRGSYPQADYGDGVNYKIYKCTMCGKNAEGNSGHLPGEASMWIGNPPAGYADSVLGTHHVPACVATCPGRSLLYGTKANVDAYKKQLRTDGSGLPLYPYKAGDGGYHWVSRNIFGHPTGDPYVEDHTVPMLEMLLEGPAAKMVLIPALAAGGLYALYERKKARVRAEASIRT